MNTDLSELEKIINYEFKERKYLETALTHASYANERTINKCENYERQEFLGDAVLELISSEYLFLSYPDIPEGEMTKIRASLVCEPALAMSARKFGLDDFIRLGKGEESTGGRHRDSIVSDICEALIGAIYLDGGLEAARRFIIDNILDEDIDVEEFKDSKSELQIRAQAKGLTVSYEVTGESGPDHDKVYEVDCMISGKVMGHGTGKTKKSAQQAAAAQALKIYR